MGKLNPPSRGPWYMRDEAAVSIYHSRGWIISDADGKAVGVVFHKNNAETMQHILKQAPSRRATMAAYFAATGTEAETLVTVP